MSAVFVRWILARDEEDDLSWAATTIITHHKDWPEIDQLYRPPDLLLESTDGLEALREQMGVEYFLNAERVLREAIWPTLAANWAVPEVWSETIRFDWAPRDPVRRTAGSARCRAESRRAVEGAERAHSRIDCGDVPPRRR